MVGFVCVLCIGNYYRAKRALERQRQKRQARLSLGNGYVVDSPKSSSTTSGSTSDHLETEKQHLLANFNPFSASNNRRRNNNNNQQQQDAVSDVESLLFQVDDGQAANLLGV